MSDSIAPRIPKKLEGMLYEIRAQIADAYYAEYTNDVIMDVPVKDEAELHAHDMIRSLWCGNIGKDAPWKPLTPQIQKIALEGKSRFLAAVKETLQGNGLNEQEKSAETIRIASSLFAQWHGQMQRITSIDTKPDPWPKENNFEVVRRRLDELVHLSIPRRQGGYGIERLALVHRSMSGIVLHAMQQDVRAGERSIC